MPSPDEPTRELPRAGEQKSGAENRLIENGLLAALCGAAVVAGYFAAKFFVRWILEIA